MLFRSSDVDQPASSNQPSSGKKCEYCYTDGNGVINTQANINQHQRGNKHRHNDKYACTNKSAEGNSCKYKTANCSSIYTDSDTKTSRELSSVVS